MTTLCVGGSGRLNSIWGLSPFSPKADEVLGEEPVVPMNPTLEANHPHHVDSDHSLKRE
ncbi:hypothetical protein [Pyrococcus kukulkanii]|uniref:hypothetical protein n=1 Tax=Pyrococcus kukulkanii TaxID=1609559 RepID=UPI000AE69ECE|nr:hypothetical protein [Pyrococcus kukulkanii]